MSSKSQKKEESRKKIMAAAAALFRKKGYHSTGVDAVMSKAGLTAGAFYAHYHSKSHLLEEILKETLHKNFETLLMGFENKKGEDFVQSVFKRYLSEVHRDYPEKGCPIAALGTELTRESKRMSKIINKYVEDWVEIMNPHLDGDAKENRRAILTLLSMGLGAIILSRLTDGDISDDFLKI